MSKLLITPERLRAIEKRIKEIKKELMQVGAMRPGSLTKQKKPMNGGRVYDHWQLSYTHKMRSKTEYIREDLVEDMREQVETYKKFKELITEWTDLAIEGGRISYKIKASKK